MANTINVVNLFSSLTADRQQAIKDVATQLVAAIGTVATSEHRDVKINVHGTEIAMRIKSVTKKGKAFVSFIKGKNSPAAQD